MIKHVLVAFVLLFSIGQAQALFLYSGSYTPTPTTPVFTAWTGQVNSNGTNTTGCPATPPPGQTFASCLTATKSSGTIAAGDCVFVFVDDNGNGELTVTDDAGDNFSSAPAGYTGPSGGTIGLQTYYLLNAPGGGSHVRIAEINGQTTVRGVQVEEASNCGHYLDPAVATGIGASTGTAGTSISSGSMTTSVGGDLIIGVAVTNTSTTSITPGTGFAGLSSAPTSSGATVSTGAYSTSGTQRHFFIETEWQKQTAAGPIAATFTSGSDTWAAVAIAVAPVGYSPPPLTLAQSPVTIGDNVTFGSGGNGQQCVWHIPAIGTGDAVVGYLHSTDVGDSIPMAPDYINIGSTATQITPSVQWSPYGEDITYFYQTGITGNPTTLTIDFPSSDGGTLGFNSCNIGLAEYTGVGSFVVTNPALISGTTTIATSVTPSSAARIWAQAAIASGYSSGFTAGYNSVHVDWPYHGIGSWQSGAANLTGTQTLTAQLNGSNPPSGVLGAIALQSAAPTEEAFPNGTPLSIASAIPASNWDLGGQGLAFQANDVCGIGIYTTLGADRLNVTTTTDTTSPNGLKIGCNELNDYHKYTVNVTSSSTYQATLRVANIQSGATYTIQDCNPTCTNVATGLAVPNTGDYDTFSNVTSGSFSLTSGVQIIKVIVSAVGSSGFAGDFDSLQIAAPGATTISGILLSNGTNFTTPASAGSTIDTITAQCSAGSCSGATFALSASGSCSTETANGSFAISGSNLNIGGSTVNAGSYPIGIAVTLSGATNSGICYPTTLMGAASGSGVLTLTNGPPNIPNASPGSCTTTTCTWIEAGINGEAVSDVYLDMKPMSQNYTATCPGAFTIADTTHFAITCSSDGTRSVGHITTASALSAGDYATSVSANGVTQNITVHAVSGTSAGCSASGLSSASASAGSYTNGSTGPGGIVLIPAGCSLTLSGDMNPASNNQVIIGAGPLGSASGGSTFNGNGNNSYGACVGNCQSGSGSPTGDALMNIEFTGATLNCTPGNDVCKEATQTNENWVIRNMYYHDNDQGIADKGCGAQIYNTRFVHNAYNAFHGTPQANCPTNEPQIIAGSEWTQNGFCGCDNNADAGQKWINANYWILDVYNDYMHQNYEKPLWMDSDQQGSNQQLNFYGNTLIANGDTPFFEAGDMTINVYQNFLIHNGDGTTPTEICQSTCASYGGQITNSGSANISVYYNNFVQAANGSNIDSAFLSGDYHDYNGVTNIVFNNNTVTMLQASPGSTNGFGCYCSAGGDIIFDGTSVGSNPSGDNAYQNQYHLNYSGANTGSDLHFNWFAGGPTTFASWQGAAATCSGGNCSASNPDNNGSGSGTIDTSGAYQGTGCTHVACSSAGVESGDGRPD